METTTSSPANVTPSPSPSTPHSLTIFPPPTAKLSPKPKNKVDKSSPISNPAKINP